VEGPGNVVGGSTNGAAAGLNVTVRGGHL